MGAKTRRSLVMSVLVLAVAGIFSCNCQGTTPSTVASPPHITDQSSCAAACANMRTLGCAEGLPMEMGTTCGKDSDCKGPDGGPDPVQSCAANGLCIVSCVNFCIASENAGVWLDPACVAQIDSCSKLQTCAPSANGVSCVGSSCKVAPSNAKPQ